MGALRNSPSFSWGPCEKCFAHPCIKQKWQFSTVNAGTSEGESPLRMVTGEKKAAQRL